MTLNIEKLEEAIEKVRHKINNDEIINLLKSSFNFHD